MQVFVKTLSGRTITIEVQSSEMTRDIKDKIEEEEGLPTLTGLIFSEKQLEDGKISNYNILRGSTLHLERLSRGPIIQIHYMQNFVENSDGKKITLEVEFSEITNDFRDKIEENEGLPALVFLGKQLEDGRTHSEYNIQKESIIYLGTYHTLPLLHIVDNFLGSNYPQYILKSAARLNNDQETVGSKYFSLYGKILDYWFPPVNGYDICPHWTPDYTNSEEFNVTFVIEYKQRPFLLLEVKP
ncbi:hypothetical protein EDB92DRAFT_1789548 [Lactarius akahatsu]|uniref:Ubiquitin-like domain-containing protein n=1 Tax=Lactarius akahatsu TaxID=416441 RepID=A0AAD4LQP5_9AGAM|nr:hypothetical protein EDB92DRAFT_1789548 [Lactarius akahatsu]